MVKQAIGVGKQISRGRWSVSVPDSAGVCWLQELRSHRETASRCGWFMHGPRRFRPESTAVKLPSNDSYFIETVKNGYLF